MKTIRPQNQDPMFARRLPQTASLQPAIARLAILLAVLFGLGVLWLALR